VAVFVGPARREFLIHPELLCNVSRHMADMLSGAAKEREMKRVHYSRHKLQKMLFPQGKQPGAKVCQEQGSKTSPRLKLTFVPAVVGSGRPPQEA